MSDPLAGMDCTQTTRREDCRGTPVTLIRHVDAGDRRRWPGDDDLRPLSALGCRREGGKVCSVWPRGEVDKSQLPTLSKGACDLAMNTTQTAAILPHESNI
jgi:hypothetical protein